MGKTRESGMTDAQLQEQADAAPEGKDPFQIGSAARKELESRRGNPSGLTPTQQEDKSVSEGLGRIERSSSTLGQEVKNATSAYQADRNDIVSNKNDLSKSFASKSDSLAQESRDAAKKSSVVYDNLATKSGSIMEQAEREAQSAMSLRDYMDPNNAVIRGTRQVFNDEGQQQQGMFEKNAGGETRRGQADFGVLSSLGAQSAGYGNMGPMTVGQQVAMMANSQRQAADAYAQTQKRVQALRDQGLQANIKNRDTGLAKGFDRNDAVYSAGLDARDRFRTSVQDRTNLQGTIDQSGQQFRDEDNFYTGQGVNLRQEVESRRLGVTGEDYNLSTQLARDKFARDYAAETARIMETLRKQGRTAAELQSYQQARAADMAAAAQRDAALIGAAGTVAGAAVGGIAGGPAGAAGGAAVGGAAGAAAAGGGRTAAPVQQAPAQTQTSNAPTSSFNAYLMNRYPSQGRATA